MIKKNKIRLIGRREFVDFPELGMFNIEAKIDTGAYTTALHCHDIEEREINGKATLCFKLLDPSHPEYNEQEHQFTHFSKKIIKSSSGETEERYIISTLVRMAKKNIRCKISLTDRASMRYPILIGRKLLKNKFIIDVANIHTGGLLKQK